MDLTKYYSEICTEKLLGKEEEEKLFKEYYISSTTNSRKEEIRNRIIKSNLRFVFKEAKNYSKNDPDSFVDYICAGNEGLVVAFEKFNPGNGVRFLSYAGWWVKQRILNAMSEMRIVSLPIWKQQLAARIQKAKENNESVTLAELKELFPEVKPKYIEELSKTKYLTFYIDDIDESEFEIDPIGDEIQTKLDNEKLLKAVSSLPSPHKEVIAKLFGLEDGEEHTVATLCKHLKIPKEVIRQIKEEGLKKLREILED
jgi:RNA polymerase primary sigma factor